MVIEHIAMYVNDLEKARIFFAEAFRQTGFVYGLKRYVRDDKALIFFLPAKRDKNWSGRPPNQMVVLV